MYYIPVTSSEDFIPHEGVEGELYSAMIDGFKLIPSARSRKNHGVMTASAQRPDDEAHQEKIFEDFKKKRKLSHWTITIAVHGKCRVTDKNGKLIAVQLPEDLKEAEDCYMDVEFPDGQNRTFVLERIRNAKLASGYPVYLSILDDPTPVEVMEEFCEMNGTAKPIAKDLLFAYHYDLGKLPRNQERFFEIIMKANEDPNHPLYKKIKIGNGVGFSAKTIVEFCCCGSRDIIAEMEKANKRSFEDQYDVFMKHWMAIAMENASDSTKGSPDKNAARQRLSAQKVAYASSVAETAIGLLRSNDKHLTTNNFRTVYRTWVRDVLKVNKLVDSDNATTDYFDVDGNRVATVTDRWNGRGRAIKAIQADHDLICLAYANRLHV